MRLGPLRGEGDIVVRHVEGVRGEVGVPVAVPAVEGIAVTRWISWQRNQRAIVLIGERDWDASCEREASIIGDEGDIPVADGPLRREGDIVVWHVEGVIEVVGGAADAAVIPAVEVVAIARWVSWQRDDAVVVLIRESRWDAER